MRFGSRLIAFIVVRAITPVIGLSAMRPTASEARVNRDSSSEQLLAAQLRLLFGNANLGVVVNIVAAAILGALQWGIVSRPTILAWCLYITLVSIARYAFARRYWQVSDSATDLGRWRSVFMVGVALAGDWLGRSGHSALPSGPPDKPGFSRLRPGGHDARRLIGAGPQAGGVPHLLNPSWPHPRSPVFS